MEAYLKEWLTTRIEQMIATGGYTLEVAPTEPEDLHIDDLTVEINQLETEIKAMIRKQSRVEGKMYQLIEDEIQEAYALLTMFAWQRKFGSEAEPEGLTEYLSEQYPPIVHPIALDFTEGQDVILLKGAKVHGLTTKCNQPGTVVHIQYSDEFGFTYVVKFGSLGMYAYVGADGLEAVAEVVAPAIPLLDLYPGVDEGDLLPATLDPVETMELDRRWRHSSVGLRGVCRTREGVVVETKPNLDYALVRFQFGTTRWCHIDEIKLVLKASALEIETLQTEVQSAS
jgi:hypothetical protein